MAYAAAELEASTTPSVKNRGRSAPITSADVGSVIRKRCRTKLEAARRAPRGTHFGTHPPAVSRSPVPRYSSSSEGQGGWRRARGRTPLTTLRRYEAGG